MKSLVDLLEHLLQDCGRKCAAPCSRDVGTLRARVKNEGDSFITITLPVFCRDFERSLDQGRIAPGAFHSFKKWKAGIPAWLRGFLCKVFDKEGHLLPEPSIDCIRAIRQICLFCKKVERPCSEARSKAAIEVYRKCDDEIVSVPGTQYYRWTQAVARVLCASLHLGELSRGSIPSLIPKHGPGATEERISGNQKFRFTRWHKRLSAVGFTHLGFGVPRAVLEELYPSSWPDENPVTLDKIRELGLPTHVGPGDERPVRVALVPKTQKTPRVIAVEPMCMQYTQQALKRYLVGQIDHCHLTAGHINFVDQTVNQDLALASSRDQKLATLDMSEASDRVSWEHARDMFSSVPFFWELVDSCRSRAALLPGGDTIPLKKFASMGSALCFPVEAMMFFVSIIASRLHRAGVYPTAHSVYSFGRDVYVYGDDLIVPTDEAAAISDDLESLGLKVNRHKSFWTGKFRESCGADCYDNEHVTPVYMRRDLPTDRKDASGILSTVATVNQLWSAGYRKTATAMKEAVERLLGRLPQVPVDSPAIGWHHFSEVVPVERWNVQLQRAEALLWTASPSRVRDPVTGYYALAKCIRKIAGSTRDFSVAIQATDPEHLEYSPRPYSLTLKRRRVPLLT